MRGAINRKGSLNWYVAPTYRQAKQVAWKSLLAMVPRQYWLAKNETDLTLLLRNESTIGLRGADNSDSLRGVGLDLVASDEASFMQPNVWPEILRPALSDRMGRALFITTPKGYDWVYDLYTGASVKPDWQAWQFTTAEGGNVSPEELDAARADLDAKTYRQEYEASFETMTGRVYYSFDRDRNVRPDIEDNNGELYIGMDFNVNPMTATVAIRAADQLHFINEIVIEDGNTEVMGHEIKRRYANRKIRIYPDPTGNARKTSAPVGQTDFTILRGMGFAVYAPQSPYMVADKINTVNAAMCNSSGTRRVFIKRGTCPQLTRGLDGLTFKDGKPDKSSGLDHITDSAAYLICYELPMRSAIRRVKVMGV